MGIFGNLQQPGMFGSLMGGLGTASNTLMGAGEGLLSGQNWRQGLAYGLQGAQAGMQTDIEKRKDAKRRDALKALMASPEFAQMDPATQNYLAQSPGLMDQVLGNQLAPKGNEYSSAGDGTIFSQRTGKIANRGKRDIRNDANGVPRYTDTGEAVYQADQSASDGTGFFPGRSPIAAALNYKIQNGEMTKDEAADYAAMHFGLGPNGEMIPITPSGMKAQTSGGQGNAPLTGPKLTEDMRKASGFAIRAAEADKILSDPSVADAGKTLSNKIAAGVPGVGNYLVPEAYQEFDQAQRDFINATLRRESGAAISESEFQNGRLQYFPQPGDGPKVLAQKKKNREQVIKSLRFSGDPAPTYGGQDASGGGASNTTSNGIGWSVNP